LLYVPHDNSDPNGNAYNDTNRDAHADDNADDNADADAMPCAPDDIAHKRRHNQ